MTKWPVQKLAQGTLRIAFRLFCIQLKIVNWAHDRKVDNEVQSSFS